MAVACLIGRCGSCVTYVSLRCVRCVRCVAWKLSFTFYVKWQVAIIWNAPENETALNSALHLCHEMLGVRLQTTTSNQSIHRLITRSLNQSIDQWTDRPTNNQSISRTRKWRTIEMSRHEIDGHENAGHVSGYYYYYYYKRQINPAVSEASRTGYKNYNVNTQTGPRKADTITNYMIHWTDGF